MTFLEMQTAVLDDLGKTTTDPFYTLVMIKRYINRAKNRVEGAHNWPHLERSMKRDSEASEYYNYPENWKQDSIYKLKFDDDDYTKVRFSDYLKHQEDDGTDEIFSDFRNRFFIHPAPTSVITHGIEIWGQEYSADLSGDSDTTPFTLEREIEEIICNVARGMVVQKDKSKRKEGIEIVREEMTRLEIINHRILKRKSSYHFKDRSMFEKLNLFPGDSTKIGNFTSN